MADPRSPDGEFSDSDLQWYDRLAAGQAVGASANAVREADALRSAIQAERERAMQGPGPQEAARQLDRLHQRADREGLWEPTSRGSGWRWPVLVPAAAALVLAAVFLGPQLYDTLGPGYDEPPGVYGEPRVVQVREPSPRKAAEVFAGALRQAGLKAGVFHQRPAYVVDFQLDVADLPKAEAALRARGVQAVVGYNRVVFMP